LFFFSVFCQNYSQDKYPGNANQTADSTCAPTTPNGYTCISWSSVTQVLTNNSNGATSDNVDTDDYTNDLFVYNFGFNIPNGYYIWGIEVNISRFAASGEVYDQMVMLMKDGEALYGSDKCSTYCQGQWRTGGSYDGTAVTYGSKTNLWNAEWNSSDINNSNFGVIYRAYSQSQGASLKVDFISMSVYYDTTAPPIQASSAPAIISSSASSNGGVIAAVVIVLLLLIIIGLVVAFLVIRRKRPGMFTLKSATNAYLDKNGPIQPKPEPTQPTNVVNSNPNESSTPLHTPPNEKAEPQGWAASFETQENGTTEIPLDNENNAARIVADQNQMDTVAMLQNSNLYKPPPKEKPQAPPPKEQKEKPQAPPKEQKPIQESQKPKSQMGGWAASGNKEEKQPEKQQEKQQQTEDNSFTTSQIKNLNYPSPKSLPTVANYANTGNVFGKNVVFGVPLALSRVENDLPVVIYQTITHLFDYVNEEGILRLAGAAQDIKELKNAYNNGQTPDLTKYDCHAVGGALKNYLRELPISLLIMTQGFKEAIDNNDLDLFCKELQAIPQIHQSTIQYLFQLLNQISSNSAVNKMPAPNLAIVFRPTLKLSDNVLVLLIDRYPEIASKMGW